MSDPKVIHVHIIPFGSGGFAVETATADDPDALRFINARVVSEMLAAAHNYIRETDSRAFS